MPRYYEPEIFHQMLDGIDLDNHVIASYYIKDRLEGEKFLDHYALIKSMAIEGSTGSWERVEEDTEDLRIAMSSKLVGYHEVPYDDPYTRSAVVQLAFPIRAWGDNITMMLLAIAGNCFAFCQDLKLTDVFIGKNLLKQFKGPKFGVEGIRELVGVEDRPLSLHIIKPKMGMTPKQTADQVYQTALGGAELCKDDEMQSDSYNNTIEERIPQVMEAIEKAAIKTGRKKMIYLVSITDEGERMHAKARRAVELGANGLLITYSAGLAAFRKITEDPDINIPVMMHPSHLLAMLKSVSFCVPAKLARLCGADLSLTPTIWSTIPGMSMEEGIRVSFNQQAPWGHIKRGWAMPAAGMYPGLAEVLIGEFGNDIIIPSGGGMLGHPDGYREGAQAWQQAISAVMSDIPLPEAALQSGNEPLKHALEKWGYIEKRPVTPWFRQSPDFQPKPKKFD